MNPFSGSINRKGYLVWNIALSLIFYLIRFSLHSKSALTIYYVFALIIGTLLIVRRLQSTGLNMWLLLCLLLPIANLIFLIALFFIPPRSNTAAPSQTGASRGFKITIGIIITLFLMLCIAVGVGLTH
jgi:uncharacterized membrane protein YhaH (DUF805 family)